MADSFSKKENNKKKAKKRQDKIAKREDRKTNNNKGKSFEDMIAYVDINGNLTSTPPHLQNREKDLQETKELNKIPTEETETIFTGIVTYSSEKGYGFITEDETRENVFFHHTQSDQEISTHDKVSYKKEATPKGYRAVDIKK